MRYPALPAESPVDPAFYDGAGRKTWLHPQAKSYPCELLFLSPRAPGVLARNQPTREHLPPRCRADLSPVKSFKEFGAAPQGPLQLWGFGLGFSHLAFCNFHRDPHSSPVACSGWRFRVADFEGSITFNPVQPGSSCL